MISFKKYLYIILLLVPSVLISQETTDFGQSELPKVLIESKPSHAQVYLDTSRNLEGYTPFELKGKKKGYSIRWVKLKYYAYSDTIFPVKLGIEKNKLIELKEERVSINVKSELNNIDQKNAIVLIDKKTDRIINKGQTPFSDTLIYGSYEIILTKKGFQRDTIDFSIDDTLNIKMNVVLNKIIPHVIITSVKYPFVGNIPLDYWIDSIEVVNLTNNNIIYNVIKERNDQNPQNELKIVLEGIEKTDKIMIKSNEFIVDSRKYKIIEKHMIIDPDQKEYNIKLETKEFGALNFFSTNDSGLIYIIPKKEEGHIYKNGIALSISKDTTTIITISQNTYPSFWKINEDSIFLSDSYVYIVSNKENKIIREGKLITQPGEIRFINISFKEPKYSLKGPKGYKDYYYDEFNVRWDLNIKDISIYNKYYHFVLQERPEIISKDEAYAKFQPKYKLIACNFIKTIDNTKNILHINNSHQNIIMNNDFNNYEKFETILDTPTTSTNLILPSDLLKKGHEYKYYVYYSGLDIISSDTISFIYDPPTGFRVNEVEFKTNITKYYSYDFLNNFQSKGGFQYIVDTNGDTIRVPRQYNSYQDSLKDIDRFLKNSRIDISSELKSTQIFNSNNFHCSYGFLFSIYLPMVSDFGFQGGFSAIIHYGNILYLRNNLLVGLYSNSIKDDNKWKLPLLIEDKLELSFRLKLFSCHYYLWFLSQRFLNKNNRSDFLNLFGDGYIFYLNLPIKLKRMYIESLSLGYEYSKDFKFGNKYKTTLLKINFRGFDL